MEAKSRNSPRKKLADISNLPLRKRLSSQDKAPEQIPAASKEYIERIQKEQPRTNMCQDLNDEVKPMKCEEAGDLSLGTRNDEKARNLKKRPQSKSMGSSEQVQSEDKTENKRSCVRRQSARFKPEALKFGEDSFDVQDKCALLPPTSDPVQENRSTSICTSSSDLHCYPSSKFEPTLFGRTSLSRPSREAAKKVQSYKEIPVNVKMRRPQ